MELDSVRELKAALHESVIVPMATSFVDRSAGLRAQLRPFFGLLRRLSRRRKLPNHNPTSNNRIIK